MNKKTKTALILTLASITLLITATKSSDAIILSEIMYNPIGDDSIYEYIELYNNETNEINLSDINITGINIERKNLTIGKNQTFVIAAKKNLTLFKERYGYFPNLTFSGSLSNTGEKICILSLKENKTDCITYNNTIANSNNRSIEIFSHKMYESPNGGTIFSYNKNTNTQINQTENSALTNTTIPENKTNENRTNQTENSALTNTTIPENKTDENKTNQTETTNKLCCKQPLDIISDSIFYSYETLKYRIISNNECNYTYYIQDLSGNIIKSKRISKTSSKKSLWLGNLNTNIIEIVAQEENCSIEPTKKLIAIKYDSQKKNRADIENIKTDSKNIQLGLRFYYDPNSDNRDYSLKIKQNSSNLIYLDAYLLKTKQEFTLSFKINALEMYNFLKSNTTELTFQSDNFGTYEETKKNSTANKKISDTLNQKQEEQKETKTSEEISSLYILEKNIKPEGNKIHYSIKTNNTTNKTLYLLTIKGNITQSAYTLNITDKGEATINLTGITKITAILCTNKTCKTKELVIEQNKNTTDKTTKENNITTQTTRTKAIKNTTQNKTIENISKKRTKITGLASYETENKTNHENSLAIDSKFITISIMIILLSLTIVFQAYRKIKKRKAKKK